MMMMMMMMMMTVIIIIIIIIIIINGTERKISHLLYMDDLKLLGRNVNDLKNKIKIVKQLVKI